MKKTIKLFGFVIFANVIFSTFGCREFKPIPVNDVGFKARAKNISDKEINLSVVALSVAESKKIFGVNIDTRNIQAVWMEIENKSEQPYWLFPIRTDPSYYSPAEVAYMNRFYFSSKRNRELKELFIKNAIPFFIPPKETVSGFLYTEMNPGQKYIKVNLLGLQDVKNYSMITEVPGIKADYQEVDFENLYRPEKYIDCDKKRLYEELKKMPCCTTNDSGSRNGDPLNLVFVGEIEDVFAALAAGGWDVTERLSLGSAWRTVRSFLLGREYLYSPVSSLYVFGRRQDAAFQKARKTIDERNHLRIWMTPLTFNGKAVWIGQTSRDIGVKLTLKTGFLFTHVIDSDVDNDRYYLVQNLVNAKKLKNLAYVGGVGESSLDEPKYNLGGDEYFTDGLRATFFVSKPSELVPKVKFLNWEFPADVDKYSKEITGLQ